MITLLWTKMFFCVTKQNWYVEILIFNIIPTKYNLTKCTNYWQ